MVVLALGIVLSLGVMNVFWRDIGQLIPIIMQMLFWLTPIVYPVSIIPESYQHLLNLNPMYPITHAYQQILVYGAAPTFDGGLATTAIIALVLILLSLFLFRRASAEMVDVL